MIRTQHSLRGQAKKLQTWATLAKRAGCLAGKTCATKCNALQAYAKVCCDAREKGGLKLSV